VCDGFKFDFETCSIAMQFFDRFLSEVEIGVEQLQVAALVCIWTASKMHEQRVVRSKDIEKYFGSFATAAECRVLELKLLVKGLHWNTASFTPIAFIRRLLHCLMPWSEAAAALSAVQPLIRLVETDKEFLKLWPSEVAMAVLEAAYIQAGNLPGFMALLQQAQALVGNSHMPQRQPTGVVRLQHLLAASQGVVPSKGHEEAPKAPDTRPNGPVRGTPAQRSPVEDPPTPMCQQPVAKAGVDSPPSSCPDGVRESVMDCTERPPPAAMSGGQVAPPS
ncbi:CCND1, partial [Symbiodinium sp. KB8]